ncbi:MAG: chromate transporter [Clostridia bacterium]|nr:chromate transporter [Clostridia bacterium]
MIYLELFLTFLMIGAFTFGGGYAMLPLIQQAVLSHGWVSEQSLIDFIAVSESTPGPFAVNISTYVGAEVGGVLGAVCATLGVVLPSFVILLIVARFYTRFRESRIVRGMMAGLKPAVVGMIAAALLSIAATVFFPAGWTTAVFVDPTWYLSAGIAILCGVLAFRTKWHPIALIGIAAALGVLGGYLLPAAGV